MDRRGFIKGLVIGTAGAAQAVVQLATPEEVAAVQQLPALLALPEPRAEHLGRIVYIENNGNYQPFGILAEILPPEFEQIDLTEGTDFHRQIARGLQTQKAVVVITGSWGSLNLRTNTSGHFQL